MGTPQALIKQKSNAIGVCVRGGGVCVCVCMANCSPQGMCCLASKVLPGWWETLG